MNNNKSLFPKINRQSLTDVALLLAIFVMAVVYKMIRAQAL
ncbi:MAG: hypothetical protein ACO1NX_05190 [Chitinophagaceae bacterium]